MSDALRCWRCGASVADLPLPLARRAECTACEADLHVCRLCELYRRGIAKECREPVAEEVKDKERANFCDYFQASPQAFTEADTGDAVAARAELSTLFGLQGGPGTGAPEGLEEARLRREREAREQLDRLFGGDPEPEDYIRARKPPVGAGMPANRETARTIRG